MDGRSHRLVANTALACLETPERHILMPRWGGIETGATLSDEFRVLEKAFRTKYVTIGESATGGYPVKILEAYSTGNNVTHVHIAGAESCSIKGRRHFNLPVDTLFAQNRNARTTGSTVGSTDVILWVEAEPGKQFRLLSGLQQVKLLLCAIRIIAQRLHVKRGL